MTVFWDQVFPVRRSSSKHWWRVLKMDGGPDRFGVSRRISLSEELESQRMTALLSAGWFMSMPGRGVYQ